MRRLDELSLSPKKKYSTSRTNSNYVLTEDNGYGVVDATNDYRNGNYDYRESYASLTGSEQSDDYWTVQSEETLV